MKDVNDMTDIEKVGIANWFGEAKLYASLNLIHDSEQRRTCEPHVQKIADALGITIAGVYGLVSPTGGANWKHEESGRMVSIVGSSWVLQPDGVWLEGVTYICDNNGIYTRDKDTFLAKFTKV